MKKIEIINKVTEINVEVVELLEKTDDNIEDAKPNDKNNNRNNN